MALIAASGALYGMRHANVTPLPLSSVQSVTYAAFSVSRHYQGAAKCTVPTLFIKRIKTAAI